MADLLFESSSSVSVRRLVVKHKPPYVIAQLSDCHLFAERDKCGYNDINPYDALAAVFSAIGGYQVDAVLCTGDISGDGSAQSYRHFQSLWQAAEIEAVLFTLAGNHDSPVHWPADWQPFTAYQYHALPANWHLHCLPSTFAGARGSLTETGIGQCRNRLVETAGSNQYHLMAIHHPLYPANEWMDKHRLDNPEQLLHLIEQSEGVQAVVHGHVHTARVQQHSRPNGDVCRLYACPSSCWQWGNTAHFSVAAQTPGFRLIELSDGGQLHTSVHYLADSPTISDAQKR
ncbi:metallophosphoesterase family protein [Alteromonas oceanisediminis]|uniref:metallophosphoesterase family protein n=1 Tax=Alteromonas oceanisediminis TaxID=2836180 RepID=UPI001BD9F10C|nr:metallophosphoesterase [Alteromonas oceanisediminis]MBT0585354.1 metallophosphoesterase [Alteromonas oceanisediminis]